MKNLSNEDQNAKFSYYLPPITNVSPKISTTLSMVYQRIKGEKLKEVTERIQKESDKKHRNELKRTTLPFVTFSGVFKKRNTQGLIKQSGLICCDLDSLDDQEDAGNKILSILQPALLFRSPSGNGLKVVYAIKLTDGEHGVYFEALRNFFKTELGLTMDNGKDISRGCFLCHDRDAFYSYKPEELDQAFLDTFLLDSSKSYKPNQLMDYPIQNNGIVPTSPEDLFKNGKKYIESREQFVEGNRHNFITRLAGFLHRTCINKSDAILNLTTYAQPGFDEAEIIGIVKRIYNNSKFAGVAPMKISSRNTINPSKVKSQHNQLKEPIWPVESWRKKLRELYITFPLRLLWIPKDSFKTRINEILADSREKSTGEIPTSIKVEYLIDTLHGKIAPELLLLLAAVKSIIGIKRNYAWTTRDNILARMYGPNPDREFTKRYSFDKLTNNAMERGLLSRVSGGPGCRGFYVSIRYKPEELSKKVIEALSRKREKIEIARKAANDIAAFRKSDRKQDKQKPQTMYPLLKAI